ncbi:phage tail protein [Paenibacillus sp. 1011MAR3C5]|uniref:phage tail protein n=1 Tax=Paenibacillus sp. 1011MAR3C5 TaxID=1675787 RepID=UPI000E6BB1D6|nr:tail fiber protein [Paenibacillus sp. 1011MAR3C5]RJE87688.1 phage tail protein [Paenibacillus sp. 1011MAR3C5]
MDPYLGEIRIFAGNFPPVGWALCNGQLMQIRQYTALYSVIGVQYGGDGKTTFALPNLMGQASMGTGQGPGLTPRMIGQQVGSRNETLTHDQMPKHMHVPQAVNQPGKASNPTNQYWAETASSGRPPKQLPIYNGQQPNVQMLPTALSVQGGSQPHNNMQPFLAMNFIISLEGVFPPRQ